MTPGRRLPMRRGQAVPPPDGPGARCCANPLCWCETAEFTCSPWCGPVDVRQGSRCPCQHEACGRSRAGAPRVEAGELDLYPAVLDRFRLDRRLAAVRTR